VRRLIPLNKGRPLVFYSGRVMPSFTSFVASSIARTLPTRHWYPALLHLTHSLAFGISPLIRLTPYRTDIRRKMVAGWLMDCWLRHFAHYERSFPIPIRIRGVEVVHEGATNPSGMAILSAHLPLANTILRALVEMNHRPTAAISHVDALWNGKVPVWGVPGGVEGLEANKNVLLKARKILREGGSVAAMIDTGLGAPLNVNILRLLGSVEARAIFATAELQPNGDILIEFHTPPDPLCRTDESIVTNLEFFRAKVDRIMCGVFSKMSTSDPSR
jgi:hypothetical protein